MFFMVEPRLQDFYNVGDSKDLLSRLRTAVIGPIINFCSLSAVRDRNFDFCRYLPPQRYYNGNHD